MNGTPSYLLAMALLIALALIGAWDIWSLFMGHKWPTVSDVLGGWGVRFPILPLLIGLMIGHLFWPR